MNIWIGAIFAALLLGAGGGWYVQGLRCDSEIADIRATDASALLANVDAVNQKLVLSRAKTETLRTTFIQEQVNSDAQITALESDIAAGRKRLRLNATCSATVQPAGANASGTGGGTAELTPAAESSYFALRRGIDEQQRLFQFCRAELKKRSAPTDQAPGP